jgi:hypothetical protein
MDYQSRISKKGDSCMAAAQVLPFTSRQLNITLPESMASELEAIAGKNNWSMQELVLNALGLLKLASDTAASRNKLVIADDTGKPLREVVLRIR